MYGHDILCKVQQTGSTFEIKLNISYLLTEWYFFFRIDMYRVIRFKNSEAFWKQSLVTIHTYTFIYTHTHNPYMPTHMTIFQS